jgi:hypothetical protein
MRTIAEPTQQSTEDSTIVLDTLSSIEADFQLPENLSDELAGGRLLAIQIDHCMGRSQAVLDATTRGVPPTGQ